MAAMAPTTVRAQAQHFDAGIGPKRVLSLDGGGIRGMLTLGILEKSLYDTFGVMTIGSNTLETGLAIVAKRIDTKSVWVVDTNPVRRFSGPDPDAGGLANKNFRLAVAVGGQDPQIVSVGTGRWGPADWSVLRPVARTVSWSLRRVPAVNAVRSLAAMMSDASDLNELMLQWLGTGSTHSVIDREVGDLTGDQFAGGALCSYVRFDVELERVGLKKLGFDKSMRQVRQLPKIAWPRSMDDLLTIGHRAGEQHVAGAFTPLLWWVRPRLTARIAAR